MTPSSFLVFDLDGTISDPAVGIGRSINYALEHHGYPTIAETEVPQFIGPPLDNSFALITGNSSPDHLAALVSKYRERYADVGYAENILYSGVPEALEVLASAGVAIGLCTSKRVDFAESILGLFGLRRHFRFLSGGEIGVHKRQQLAALLSDRTISPASIMIGDRAVDIEAARSNGLGSVGVLWGHGSVEELTAAGPGTLLAFPHELVALRNAV
ncbi:MAG: HAD hydrolase-like protein [Proteobacteria bacterium]|nr:HAD hydrolase-like protein [Pseudomonadota bacterium]